MPRLFIPQDGSLAPISGALEGILNLAFDPVAGSPLMSAATDVTGTIAGLPDVPSQFAALLFRREASGGLKGPLPGCTTATASALIAGTEPGTATFNITGWAGAVGTPAYTLNTQAELILLLVPSAVVPGPGDAVCVTDALAGISIDAISLRLPAGVLIVRLGCRGHCGRGIPCLTLDDTSGRGSKSSLCNESQIRCLQPASAMDALNDGRDLA